MTRYELGTCYGHVALTVDDLDATFVRDPDSYRIELIERSVKQLQLV